MGIKFPQETKVYRGEIGGMFQVFPMEKFVKSYIHRVNPKFKNLLQSDKNGN